MTDSTRTLKPLTFGGARGLGPPNLRVARIYSVDILTQSCTVALSGDNNHPVPVALAGSYQPQVGDIALILQNDSDLIAIDRVLPSSAPTTPTGPAQGSYYEGRATANQGSITAQVDLTGLTIALTLWPNRTYKVAGRCLLQSTEVNDIPKLSLTDNVNNLLAQCPVPITIANTGHLATVELTFTGLSGLTTFKLRAQRNSGTSTVTMAASALNPAWLRIEDVGFA
jgi:hypothetical protein